MKKQDFNSGSFCSNPLVIDPDGTQQINLSEKRPVGGTEIHRRFMPVGKPRKEVGCTVFVAGPDDQIDGWNPFFIMQVLLYHVDIDHIWCQLVVCNC